MANSPRVRANRSASSWDIEFFRYSRWRLSAILFFSRWGYSKTCSRNVPEKQKQTFWTFTRRARKNSRRPVDNTLRRSSRRMAKNVTSGVRDRVQDGSVVIDTTRVVVCGAESMKRSSVCLSVRPSVYPIDRQQRRATGLLLSALWATAPQQHMRAVSLWQPTEEAEYRLVLEISNSGSPWRRAGLWSQRTVVHPSLNSFFLQFWLTKFYNRSS